MDLPDWLRKLIPILGEEEVARYWEQLQLADPKTAKIIEVSLRRRLAEVTGSPTGEGILLEPIPAELASGEIAVGTVCYGPSDRYPFFLRRGELIQHAAIFGRSGAGKTNVAFLLCCVACPQAFAVAGSLARKVCGGRDDRSVLTAPQGVERRTLRW